MIRLSLILIFALSVVSAGPAVMLKRTMSGVPLYLVTDFEIFESNMEDTSSSEESSGTSGINERTERDASDEPIPPQPLFDYRSKKLAHRIRYPDNFDQTMKAILNNLPPRRYKEEKDFEYRIRALRSVSELHPVKKAKQTNRSSKTVNYKVNDSEIYDVARVFRVVPQHPPVELPIMPEEELWAQESISQLWNLGT